MPSQRDWELEELAATTKRGGQVVVAIGGGMLLLASLAYAALAYLAIWQVVGLQATMAMSFLGVGVWHARRRREAVAALAGDAESLHSLLALGDGELVRVRGRIIGPAAAPTGAMSENVVWQREVSATQSVPGKMRFVPLRDVHERAVDFLITDDAGEPCWVDVSDARLLWLDDRQHGFGQYELRVGDLVDVIGRKDRRVDTRAGVGYGRDAPTLNALRASATRPLLVFKIENELPRLPAPR
jgi:hypothetical protein